MKLLPNSLSTLMYSFLFINAWASNKWKCCYLCIPVATNVTGEEMICVSEPNRTSLSIFTRPTSRQTAINSESFLIWTFIALLHHSFCLRLGRNKPDSVEADRRQFLLGPVHADVVWGIDQNWEFPNRRSYRRWFHNRRGSCKLLFNPNLMAFYIWT